MTQPSNPPPLPRTMTQVMRPDAEVIGPLEVHGYVGLSVAPPGLMKSEFALWWSEGTAWDTNEKSSKKSRTVFAANDPLIRHDSEAKGRTHYLHQATGLSLTPPPKPAIAYGPLPGARRGFFEDDSGESTTIFAPRSVLASIDETHKVAVVRFFGGGYGGTANLGVCCDPMHMPTTIMWQTPSSVFLGMTSGDTWISIAAWMWRSALNGLLTFALKKITGHLMDRFIDQLAALAARWVSEAMRVVVSRVIRPAVAEFLRVHGRGAARSVAKNAGKWGIRQVTGHAPAVNGSEISGVDDQMADLWDACAESL